jgi:hypothetical protein
MERRGIRTEGGWRIQQEAGERLAPAAELEKVERERQETEKSVLDLLTANPTGEKEEDERDGRRFEPHPQSSSVARSPLLG